MRSVLLTGWPGAARVAVAAVAWLAQRVEWATRNDRTGQRTGGAKM
jgi:hypothetical protein